MNEQDRLRIQGMQAVEVDQIALQELLRDLRTRMSERDDLDNYKEWLELRRTQALIEIPQLLENLVTEIRELPFRDKPETSP